MFIGDFGPTCSFAQRLGKHVPSDWSRSHDSKNAPTCLASSPHCQDHRYSPQTAPWRTRGRICCRRSAVGATQKEAMYQIW